MWAGDTMCSPAERLTNNITRAQGDSILRADLMKLCRLFRRFGRDSTLLSCLAYQVGAYRLLGSKDLPKSRLIQKLEAGNQGPFTRSTFLSGVTKAG